MKFGSQAHWQEPLSAVEKLNLRYFYFDFIQLLCFAGSSHNTSGAEGYNRPSHGFGDHGDIQKAHFNVWGYQVLWTELKGLPWLNPTSPYLYFAIVFIHHVFWLKISTFKDEQFNEEMLHPGLFHFQCWRPVSCFHLLNMGTEEGRLWIKMRSRVWGQNIHAINSCSPSFGLVSWDTVEYGTLLQSPAKRLMTVSPERACISAAEVVSYGYYRQWVCCIRSYTFSYQSNLIAVGQKR